MPSLIYIERFHLFVRVITSFSLELHRYSRDVPNSPSLCSLYRCQQCWFYVTELVSLTCTHIFSKNSTRVKPYIPRRGRCTVIFYTWIVWILPKCVILKTHNLPNWQRAAFFFFFLPALCSIWDPCSLTRDWTCALLHWKHRHSITGSPGKSQELYF